jgi:uracil-DNA glycosylase family 4
LRDKGATQVSLFAEDEDALKSAPAAVTSGPRSLALLGDESITEQKIVAGREEPCRANAWAGIMDLGLLRSKVLACSDCSLRSGANNVVFGDGDPRTRVMLIGEAPGQSEDESGNPFVGRAGKLLDGLLSEARLRREDVFICNIAKCRPPRNRLPEPAEVSACLPHLRAQMRIISPRIVVALGALSSQTLVDPSIRVTRDRGKWFEEDGVHYLVTFHPAAVLRDERRKRGLVESDMKNLRAMLDRLCDKKR